MKSTVTLAAVVASGILFGTPNPLIRIWTRLSRTGRISRQALIRSWSSAALHH